MKHTISNISVFRNASQVWATPNFIFWDTEGGLCLITVNNFSFEIDYLPGTKSSWNFSVVFSSCHPVGKAKLLSPKGKTVRLIHHTSSSSLQVDPVNICTNLLPFHVLCFHSCLCLLPLKPLVCSLSFFTLILLTLQLTGRAGQSTEHLVVHFVSNQRMKEKFFCKVLSTYHSIADNIALPEFLGTCGLNNLNSYATHKYSYTLAKEQSLFVVLITHN